jgi:hypothetical protein
MYFHQLRLQQPAAACSFMCGGLQTTRQTTPLPRTNEIGTNCSLCHSPFRILYLQPGRLVIAHQEEKRIMKIIQLKQFGIRLSSLETLHTTRTTGNSTHREQVLLQLDAAANTTVVIYMKRTNFKKFENYNKRTGSGVSIFSLSESGASRPRDRQSVRD